MKNTRVILILGVIVPVTICLLAQQPVVKYNGGIIDDQAVVGNVRVGAKHPDVDDDAQLEGLKKLALGENTFLVYTKEEMDQRLSTLEKTIDKKLSAFEVELDGTAKSLSQSLIDALDKFEKGALPEMIVDEVTTQMNTLKVQLRNSTDKPGSR